MAKKRNILFDDHPIVVPVELAKAVGLNEAIILQQVHYWCTQNKRLQQNKREGYYWTYNSIRQWQEQFPFWSESTIRRTIIALEKDRLLITGNFNRMKMDRTKWYRVNMEELENRLGIETEEKKQLRQIGRTYIEACQNLGADPEVTPELEEDIGRQIEEASAEEAEKKKKWAYAEVE